MDDKYTRISCAYYDEMEAAAVKQLNCHIIYIQNDIEKSIDAKVVDFKTKDKQEFMVLDDGQEIRLDKILSFNGITPKDREYC